MGGGGKALEVESPLMFILTFLQHISYWLQTYWSAGILKLCSVHSYTRYHRAGLRGYDSGYAVTIVLGLWLL